MRKGTSTDAQAIAGFTAAFDGVPHGVCVYDDQQRLIFCNRRYREIYAVPPRLAVRGTPLSTLLDFHRQNGIEAADFDRDVVKSALGYPDSDVRDALSVRLADGRVILIRRSNIEGGGSVDTHQDVTVEVRRFEALQASRGELMRQNMLFDAALGNMVEGLCMFDAEQRLVMCNGQYRKLYGLPAELAKPGTRHAEILAFRTASGMRLAGGTETLEGQHHRLMQKAATAVIDVEMSDGRRLTIRHQPLPDGGWVATHRDVTEEYRQFVALETRERELALQNMRLEAAVNNMSQGLCMFDKDRRLVISNDLYATLYNIPPSMLKPGTTLDEVLAHRLASGLEIVGGNQAYIDDRLKAIASGASERALIEFSDGRVILSQHHPTPDGGWVATHEDVTEQRRHEARIHYLARHDTLTGLPNRTLLHEEMQQVEERVWRGESLALLHIDLDRFKSTNDTHGHGFGDKVLVEAADRLRACAGAEGVAARLGADEFAIMTGPIEGPDEAAALGEKVIHTMAETFRIDGQRVALGASIGIALAPSDGTTSEVLIKNADFALQHAKAEGKGRYRFFEAGMDRAIRHRRSIEAGLRVALEQGQFRLYFQPLICLAHNRVRCVEALIRWEHPERGMISPAEFIPIAEETGIIVQVGEWALREAARIARDWPDEISIAVNLSPIQFRHSGLVDMVASALAATGLPAERLQIEITESLLLEETSSILATLHELRQRGVRIAMDDFGTGYSSLSYLRSFPFDKIKIDRSFISGVEGDGHAIMKAIIGLGKILGMTTTAEGIETEAQLDAVRAEGCDEVQGYLFSPPLPARAVACMLEALNRKARDLAQPRQLSA